MKKLLLTLALAGVVSAVAASGAYGQSLGQVMIENRTGRTVEYSLHWGRYQYHQYAKPGWHYPYWYSSYNPNGIPKPTASFYLGGGERNRGMESLDGMLYGFGNQPKWYFIMADKEGHEYISDVLGREHLPQGIQAHFDAPGLDAVAQ
jgi:hypothetical protein